MIHVCITCSLSEGKGVRELDPVRHVSILGHDVVECVGWDNDKKEPIY